MSTIFISLAGADVLDRRLQDASNRMTGEELDMFIRLQEKHIQSKTRKARVACGIGSEEDIALESSIQKTNNIVASLHEHD